MNSGLDCRQNPAMVDGAERIDFSVDFRYQAIGSGFFSGLDQLLEKNRGNLRHIAGDQNIPIGAGNAEGGEKAPDGPAIRYGVGYDGKTEVHIFFWGADEGHAAGGGADFVGDFLDHRAVAQREKSLIAAHAPAGSAHQNKARSSHEMILATSGRIVLLNKKVYICLLMALAMLAASPSRAAEVDSAPIVHKTQVVKADVRTGKLVRSVVVSSRPVLTKITPASGTSSADLDAIVEKASRAHNVDPLLVHSIIKVESNYNAHAVSNKGAEGLMQLTPSTARMLGVSNSFDPAQNIEAGVKYLKYLKDLYKDDRLALAAYNAGPGAVDKYKWIPPYAETQNYVYQVGKRYGEARRAADAVKPAEVKPEAKVPEVNTVEAAPVEVKPSPVQTFIDENGRLHLRTTQ
jgi:Transglycosylase SLT domain